MRSDKATFMLGKGVGKIWLDNAVRGNAIEIDFETLHNNKDQRGKCRFQRIRAKKNHRICTSSLQTQCTESSSYLEKDVPEQVSCSSSLYDLFKRIKPTWMVSMIYTKIKYKRCVLFCLFGFVLFFQQLHPNFFQCFSLGHRSDHTKSDSIQWEAD